MAGKVNPSPAMETNHVDERFETPDDPRIPPGSVFFKIGEVAKILEVKPHVLRYWEAEFPGIRPEKTRSKQRRYRRQDIALLLQIKRLRYEDQLTIARARSELRGGRSGDPSVGVLRLRSRPSGFLGRSNGDLQEQRSAALPSHQLSFAGLPPACVADLVQSLAAVRRTVLELLEAVEE